MAKKKIIVISFLIFSFVTFSSCDAFIALNGDLVDFAPTNTGKYSLGFNSKYFIPVPYFSYKPTTDSEFSAEIFPQYYYSGGYRRTIGKKGSLQESLGIEANFTWDQEDKKILYSWIEIPASFTLKGYNFLGWLSLKPGIFYLSEHENYCSKEHFPPMFLPTLTPGIGFGYAPPRGFRLLFTINYPLTLINLINKTDVLMIPLIGITAGYDFGYNTSTK